MRRVGEGQRAMTMRRRWGRIARRTVALAAVALVLSSCGSWKGIANVPLPGGPGTGSDKMTIYVQMPDTLALNVNSRVRVADVFVGRVRAIELKNWVATLTLDLQSDLKLPSNALATIGQTSLLGSQHVELAPPPDPSGAVEDRRHDPAAEQLGVPHYRTGAGEHRHHSARRRRAEPRDDPDRDLQRAQRPGRSDPGVPEQAGHVHRRAEPADARTSRARSTPPTGYCRSWASATTRWTAC